MEIWKTLRNSAIRVNDREYMDSHIDSFNDVGLYIIQMLEFY